MTKFSLFKRLLCVVLALVMLLSLSACGIGSALAAVKTARAMAKLDSIKGEAVLELELSVLSASIPATFTLPFSVKLSPLIMQANANMKMGDNSLSVFDAYLEKDDELLIIYLGSMGMWTAQQSKLGEGLSLDTKAIMGTALALSDSFEASDKELVGKFEAQRYDGKLTREVISTFLKGSGGIELSDTSFTEEDLIDALSNLPVSFWLDTKESRLIKLELDLSRCAESLIAAALSEYLGEVGSGISKAVLSVTVEDFDCVDEIIIPDEARAALE